MNGTSYFLNVFLSKIRAKREISDQFSGKRPYNITINLTKRNGFLCQVQRVFLTGFWTKKEQNVRFQADFQEKTLIIERQFFQNVTVFYDRYILFFRCFFGRGNFHHLRATGKTFSLDVCPSIQFHQLLLKPNLFFRCFFIQKKRKREISDHFFRETPYNRTTIFTKRNGFLCQVQRVFLTGFC